MTGASHRQFGYAWAAGACLVMEPYWGVAGCAAVIIGARSGSTAPDWLEFGLIRHRTVTHLPWLWILMYALSVTMVSHYNLGIIVGCLVTGFCLGALSHWVGDIGTPMGVPILNPNKRTSLRMWGTGKKSEKIPIAFAWAIVGAMAAVRFSLAPSEWAAILGKTDVVGKWITNEVAFFLNK